MTDRDPFPPQPQIDPWLNPRLVDFHCDAVERMFIDGVEVRERWWRRVSNWAWRWRLRRKMYPDKPWKWLW